MHLEVKIGLAAAAFPLLGPVATVEPVVAGALVAVVVVVPVVAAKAIRAVTVARAIRANATMRTRVLPDIQELLSEETSGAEGRFTR